VPSGRRKSKPRGSSEATDDAPDREDRSSTHYLPGLFGGIPRFVPKRYVKFLAGLLLLMPAWILTKTFFLSAAAVTFSGAFWTSPPFVFTSWGMLSGAVLLAVLPEKWTLYVYVFGHEVTHAVWVLLFRGQVHEIHVSHRGGHVISDKVNTWIALAPYFFPFYSAIVLMSYLVILITRYCGASVITDVSDLEIPLYVSLGVTWGFHLVCNFWMILRGQSDLNYGGTFFSLMVIYIVNLLILSGMLIAASPEMTWRNFLRETARNAAIFSEKTVNAFHWLAALLQSALS